MKFRFPKLPIVPVLIILAISLFSLAMLYSVGGGSFDPWCLKQLLRLCVGIVAMAIAASVNVSFWKDNAYLFYIFGTLLLLCVAIMGKVSMGAQRWLNLYFFNFQPSELMRIFIVIVMARYFSMFAIDDIRKNITLIPPLLLLAFPVWLVLMQPDLGTAMILLFVCVSIFFVCGVQVWKFVIAICLAVGCAPILWNLLHEYQRKRILMLLSPESDPSGSGYHIIQSKIALGSGGFWGKGFTHGTQSTLNFLPEKQTDFVFATLGEELGFAGCLFLLVLYGLLLTYNINVIFKTKSKFDQILVFGLSSMIFFYIFINIGMVCGILPVVGIPLPFFSYGGSAMTVLMFCQGIIFAVDNSQDKRRSIY
ncbi:MAG: rod shape-determining protein RodA [Alphaproteobacteria bacterium]|nr:rod shape-determining protein RodA [Alphaproteobacteria bacterium]